VIFHPIYFESGMSLLMIVMIEGFGFGLSIQKARMDYWFDLSKDHLENLGNQENRLL